MNKKTMVTPAYKIFSVFGVELEYMIVDQDTFNILPIAERLLELAAGPGAADAEFPDITWSNELAAHVIELKTTNPSPTLSGLDLFFAKHIKRMNELLEKEHALLLPSGMHPWMNPIKETKLWLGENQEVYHAFDQIFNCSGHGWSNLQSVHLNLPFANDEEFGNLHAAIRLLLPLIPAFAASSPFVEGQSTDSLCNRMQFYRTNCQRIPQVSGQIVPEAAFSKTDYQEQILRPLYESIAPFDPEGFLQEEWLNARGAIARFSRGSIEVRVMDIQECPAMDCALLELFVLTLRSLISGRWMDPERYRKMETTRLAQIFKETLYSASNTVFNDQEFLNCFGLPPKPIIAREMLSYLICQSPEISDLASSALNIISQHGSLAERIISHTGKQPTRIKLAETYQELSKCLQNNVAFSPHCPDVCIR